MIGMMVTLAVESTRDAEFERAFAAQAAAVRANEPGNRLYQLFRSRTWPGSYRLVEIYDDEAALAAHRSSPHMAAHREGTGPFIVAPPEIEVFDVVPHPA